MFGLISLYSFFDSHPAMEYYEQNRQSIDNAFKIAKSFRKIKWLSCGYSDSCIIDTTFQSKPYGIQIPKDSIELFLSLIEKQKFNPKDYKISSIHITNEEINLRFTDNFYDFVYTKEKLLSLEGDDTVKTYKGSYEKISIDDHHYIGIFSRITKEGIRNMKLSILLLGIISLTLSYFLLKKHFKKAKKG